MHKTFIYQLLVCCLLIFSMKVAGQKADEFTSESPKSSIRFDGGISNPVRSIAFRNNFYAVGDAKLGFNKKLYKGLNAGIAFRYTGVQVDPLMTNKSDTVFDQNLQILRDFLTYQVVYTPSINLGYDFSLSKKVFFNTNLAGGMALVRYYKVRSGLADVPKSNYNFNTPSVEGSVNLYYFFEDKIGMSVKFGYTALFRSFDPAPIGFADGEISYQNAELKGNMHFFTFALGFIFSFQRIE
jgi:hypothetical protein